MLLMFVIPKAATPEVSGNGARLPFLIPSSLFCHAEVSPEVKSVKAIEPQTELIQQSWRE